MNLWQEKFKYSQSKIDSDMQIIKDFFPACVSVEKTSVDTDKQGVDYIATLSGGAKIFIDAKTREKGASRYWKYGEPEIALELRSVVETNKIGWALSGASKAHYILYTFDPTDSEKFYMFPFQLLRKAFYENGRQWIHEYGKKTQTSDGWHSSAVFVPANTVLQAVSKAFVGGLTESGLVA